MIEFDIRPITQNTARRFYAADRPIDFATWLTLSEKLDTELVRGVLKEKMSAQYPHELIFVWLVSILRHYATHLHLGRVLGSRTAVKISENDGRLPDILFVREDNADIIRKDAVYGAPDLVIEIVSENDRPSDLIPLEADYRDLGVTEIVFIDPRRKRVRHLHRSETDYDETFLTDGTLTFATVPGFHLEIAWLFADDKPDEFTLTKRLIEAAKSGAENGEP